jgi:hypothetical protein
MKRSCIGCGKKLLDGDRYKRGYRQSGKPIWSYRCKRCDNRKRLMRHRERMDTDPEYRVQCAKRRLRSRRRLRKLHGHEPRNEAARHANSLLASAIRWRKLKKPTTCSRCGSEGNIQGHHEDYDRPYDVEWLCPKCHGKEHRKVS